MLQRTRAEQVLPIWSLFIGRYPTIEAAKKADEQELRYMLRPLGLSWRIENMLSVIRHTPDIASESDLADLPGLGNYVRAAVACFAFGLRRAIVDANVVRVYSAMFSLPPVEKVRRHGEFLRWAESLLPGCRFKEYNWGLLDLGAALRAREWGHNGGDINDA